MFFNFKHLRGKQHKEFARKRLNYTSLDKAINEGFKIENLLEEIHLRESSSVSNIDPTQEQSNLSTRCVPYCSVCETLITTF